MATHSSIPTWEIPWTEEPGGLQSMGSHKVRHDLMAEPHKGHRAIQREWRMGVQFSFLQLPKRSPQIQTLQTANSFCLASSVGRESGSGVARWFWVGASDETAAEMSAPSLSMGLLECLQDLVAHCSQKERAERESKEEAFESFMTESWKWTPSFPLYSFHKK